MLKIGICDDEDRYIEIINRYCRQYFKDGKEEIAVREYHSGNEVMQEQDLDILFLDIEMPKGSGLDVKKYFQMRVSDVRMIFCTSHREAIQEAFGKNVFGFLTKPVAYEAFQKKMDEVMWDWQMERAVMTYKTEQGVKVTPVQDIIYVKPAGRYSKIRTVQDKKEVFCHKSFGEWKEALADYGFASCHRSCYVNLAYIKQCDDEMVLSNGSRISLSRRMKKEFEEIYWTYITKMAH